MSEPGELFLVATPIGNSGDITPRAVAAIEAATMIAAEDTRVTRTLLRQLGIRKPLVSYHDHNESKRAPWLVEQMLGGANIVLVSDAGTPLLSDPGFRLVRLAIESNIRIRSLPGASAVTTGLAASGFPADRYCFLGYLPRKSGPRRAYLRRYAEESSTLVAFEAPHRLLDTLLEMREVFGNRHAVVCWNLTKRNEEYFRGTLEELHALIEGWEYVHGEITLVIAGADDSASALDDVEADKLIRALLDNEVPEKVIRRVVAQLTHAPKRSVYARILQLRRDEDGET